MKAYLMYREQDFDIKAKLPTNADALIQDLELETLFNAMGTEDPYLLAVVKTAILSGFSNDRETILYRQDILMDCLANPTVIRNLYAIALGADSRKAHASSSWLGNYPSATLNRAVDILEMLIERLKDLRKVADDHSSHIKSEGLGRLFEMLKRELGDDYLHTVEEHLKQLRFRNGVLISAGLGDGNKGDNYVLRQEHKQRQSWFQFLFGPRPEEYRFNLHPRDDAGHRCLSELNDRGINLVANAAVQSADHILSFFAMLRMELAFYVSCLNLHDTLAAKGEQTAFPMPAAPSEQNHCFEGLYDICLSLRMTERVIGNDLDAKANTLILITGANQGGKSTFLRSIGLAQLMMQCGMFVPAVSFASNMCDRLFTHYKREEDTTMQSGKLDEELSRMTAIVDELTADSIILFNESFAATNEREGSEIAENIIDALHEKQIKMFFVTHLYEFAHAYVGAKAKGVVFLRAEREEDGARTFKLHQGEPLQTSYGQDLYSNIFLGMEDVIDQ